MELTFKLDQVLFEVIYALPVLGFSINVTPELSFINKGPIGLLMFIDRVGIFT